MTNTFLISLCKDSTAVKLCLWDASSVISCGRILKFIPAHVTDGGPSLAERMRLSVQDVPKYLLFSINACLFLNLRLLI